MTRKAIAGVLLDIDDTLVDTRGAFRHALGAVAGEHLADAPDPDELVAFWRADASGWYRAHTRGEMTHREQRMRRANELHAAYGGAQMDDAAYDVWDAGFEQAFRDGWAAHPEAAAMLDVFDEHGIAFGAVSNADHAYQEIKLASVGLDRVPMLVGVDRFGVGKPDPRVFLEGARLLGLDPAYVAYVGDERDIDAHAAVEAGLGAGIWIDRFGTADEAGELGADVARVESLTGVLEVIGLTS